MKTKLFTLLTVIFTGLAFSQSHTVVPIALENDYGGYNAYNMLGYIDISTQWVYHENQLTSMVGKELTGFAFRLPQFGYNNSQPTVDLDYENFDIYISEGVSPSDFTGNFAGNVVGAQTQVRSGTLKIMPNTFPFSNPSTPPDFGQVITFDTPYTYNGGHLLVEVRQKPIMGLAKINTDVIPAGNPLSGSVANGIYKGIYQNPHIQGSSTGLGYVPIIRFTYVDGQAASRSDFDVFGFSYYPNPVTDILTFSSNQPIESVIISNMLGQEVKANLSLDKTNLDMSNLPSGNYLVKVTIEGGSKTIKVMKQ